MALSMTDKLELFEYLKSAVDIEYFCEVLMDGEAAERGLSDVDIEVIELLHDNLRYLKGKINIAINS